MLRNKDEYNGATTHFTRCYSGYQQYGVTGPCSCLRILNPTPATVIPDILRGVQPHNVPSKSARISECSGCFKNQYASVTPSDRTYNMSKNSCQCTNLDNI